MMPQLSEHFHSDEFKCRDGSEHPIDEKLICMLEAVRCHFDCPVIITSGYRSPKYNRKVGGKPKSLHLQGRAADIKVPGVPLKTLHDWIDKQYPHCGLGYYPRADGGWVHVDSRKARARWES